MRCLLMIKSKPIAQMAILCGIAFLQMYFSQGKNVSFTSKFNDGAAARMNAKNESSVLIGGLPAPASSSISRISSPSNGKIDYVHGGERELEPLPSFEFSAPAVSRLTYRLVPHRPYNMTGHQQDNLNKYQCNISKPPRSKAIKTRSELPNDNPFQEFSTYIQTNLNILFMGDSLSVEFGSWFQIASQAPEKVVLERLHKWQGVEGNKTPPHGLTAASALHGGGIIAYWRLLGFWEERTRGRPLPNRGFGWYKTYVDSLLRYTKEKGQGDEFQVVLFRISHPWVWSKSKDFVSHQKMTETVRSAQKYLGKKVIVIFQTAPFNNNVVTVEDLSDFRKMNDLIRSFVAKSLMPNVLLSDIAYFMENVIDWNARQLGMASTSENPTSYLTELLKCSTKETNQRHHIAQVCSERVTNDSISCKGNMLSNDGLHFCMETLGPRLYANWACLIQCVYNRTNVTSSNSIPNLRACERGCNEKFFSLDERILPSI